MLVGVVLLAAGVLLDPAAALLAADDNAGLDCALVCEPAGELELPCGVLVPLVQPAINERQLPLTASPRPNRRMDCFVAAVMPSFCPDNWT